MSSLILAVLLGLLYWYLMHRDKRMLRNGVVLVAALWFGITGAAGLLTALVPGLEWVWLVLLGLFPLAVLVLAGFLIANGVTMIRSEGRRLGNLLSLALGCAIPLLPLAALGLVLTGQPLAIGLAALLFFLCSYLGVVFVVFLVYAVAYGRMEHDAMPAAVVVLGSRLIDGRVPPLLRSRLDRAMEIYRETEPRPLLIPSGGQGPDESRPEGEAMAEYLVAAGALASDVLPENLAINTEENLGFSRRVQEDAGRPGSVLVVTNNYHVLRAALLARKLDADAQVVGSPTAAYYVPSAFLREFVAVVAEHRVIHGLLLLPFLALTVFLVLAGIAASG